MATADVPGGAEVNVGGLGLQHVELTAQLGAEIQEAVVGVDRRGGAIGQRAREAQADGRQLGAVELRRHAVVVALGYFQLGAEVGRPVGEPLAHHGLQRLVLVPPPRTQRQAGAREAGDIGLGLLGAREAQVGAVAVADVPVQLQQGVLHHHFQTGRHGVGADVHVPGGLRNRNGLVDGRLGDADVGLGAAQRPEVGAGARAVQFFVAAEEEQLVGNDGPAQREALGVFLELGRVVVAAVGAIETLAHQPVVTRNVVEAALEVVGAALGNGVDVGACVALLGDVVVAQVDLHRLDSVDGDRLLDRRQVVGLEPEGVADADAVDGDAVETGVLAGRRDFTALFVGLCQARVGAGVVLQVATDGRVGAQLLAADVGA